MKLNQIGRKNELQCYQRWQLNSWMKLLHTRPKMSYLIIDCLSVRLFTINTGKNER